MCMDKKYEVKVTRQAMAQMKEIVHYLLCRRNMRL
jgi:hypothetical protein